MIESLLANLSVIIPIVCCLYIIKNWRSYKIFTALVIGLFAVTSAVAHATSIDVSQEIRDFAVIITCLMLTSKNV